jgi:hypothetical protein
MVWGRSFRLFAGLAGAVLLTASWAFADTVENPIPDPAPVPQVEEDAPQSTGQLWVCCDAAGQRWSATPEVCRQRSGQVLPSRFCEKPKTVCCKQGRAEWWMPDATSCNRDGGVVADKSYCR